MIGLMECSMHSLTVLAPETQDSTRALGLGAVWEVGHWLNRVGIVGRGWGWLA